MRELFRDGMAGNVRNLCFFFFWFVFSCFLFNQGISSLGNPRKFCKDEGSLFQGVWVFNIHEKKIWFFFFFFFLRNVKQQKKKKKQNIANLSFRNFGNSC